MLYPRVQPLPLLILSKCRAVLDVLSIVAKTPPISSPRTHSIAGMVFDLIFAVIRYAAIIVASYVCYTSDEHDFCMSNNVPKYLFLIAYRLLLHPLKDYPGPLVAKFSDWYGGFYALLMRLHLVTHQDHKRYGPIVRHGPNRLVFNSAQALEGRLPKL